ncbi:MULTISPECIES: ribosome biogenesis factor YjgA [Chitinibacter]|uniref:ribosome biogenesis factor YjgA n=1 Tax=Chitinibacter TaxID=230666 RepID=UPI0004018E7E|nr:MULTISPECIES: ribosome biogenesis factor YjgA [Chitinibacter]
MAKHDHDDEIEIVSKSQLKREAEALKDLGASLLAYSPKQLEPLNLPEKLIDAIREAKKITANGAIARHKQYIGKLMRDVDPAPIQAFLDAMNGDSDQHTAWLHQIERLREKMLLDPKATEQFIADFPAVDIQQLRQLIRNANKEKQQQQEGKQVAPKAYRELFQLIKQYIPEPKLPSLNDAADDAADASDEE